MIMMLEAAAEGISTGRSTTRTRNLKHRLCVAGTPRTLLCAREGEDGVSRCDRLINIDFLTERSDISRGKTLVGCCKVAQNAPRGRRGANAILLGVFIALVVTSVQEGT